MAIPGFSAEVSLYVSSIAYGADAGGQIDVNISPSCLRSSIEFPAVYGPPDFRGACGDTAPTGYTRFAQMPAARATKAVVPMSVPAHFSFPSSSSQCNDCTNNCALAGGGCELGVTLGCAPLLAIPIAGGPLYAGCLAASTLACIAVATSCSDNCFNIGSACCPVACGPSCCDFDETCSDTGQGLCCSPGTQPCGANCCQGNEICLEGVCCPRGSTLCPDGTCCDNICCGANCCQGNEICLEGVCCPRGSTLCPDGTCCDNICGQCQGGTCVPFADGTPCANGVCCGGKCAPCCGVGAGCNRPADCCSGFCNRDNQCDCFDIGEECRFGAGSCCSRLCSVDGNCCLPFNSNCMNDGDCCSGFCNRDNQCDCFDPGEDCRFGPQSCCSGICGADGTCQ
jgi:hypothetical protein